MYNNIHGISWNTKGRPYTELTKDLKTFTRSEDIVYSKGQEKCRFFSEILGREVEDLGDSVPAVKSLKPQKSCTLHNFPTNHCAMYKAKTWFNVVFCESRLSQESEEELCKHFTRTSQI